MQILGKRSKLLLIVISVVMLVAIGVSFAAWDSMSTVKAVSGDLSTYANAKVGDVITFGKYYQTGNRVGGVEDAEYEKTPIEWLVVDKDERTGQLTLMSLYILAAGSYFGNMYYNESDTSGYHYKSDYEEVGKIQYDLAYVDSTARAFLNNLERRDLGGDSYSTADGYKTSVTPSVTTEKLYTSVGFSNRRYLFIDEYKRPINNKEYRERPATRGFYDEAFSDDEKAMIVPKVIPGYTGHRWPNNLSNPTKMAYVEGTVDKVWLPSASELNVMVDEDNRTNPSDEANSTVFEYFKNYTQYSNPVFGTKNNSLANALKTERTDFAYNSTAMNYSIPVYQYQSTVINDDISSTKNSTGHYWTRSPLSYWVHIMRIVSESGLFAYSGTYSSNVGVRPCVILKY